MPFRFSLWTLERAAGEPSLRLNLQITIWTTYRKIQQHPSNKRSSETRTESGRVMIRDLTPTNSKTKQPTVKQDRTIEDLRNQNLQLELDLTRTKLELLKLQRESAHYSPPKLVAADHSTTPGDSPTAKPILKDLHQDPNIQS